MVKRERPPTREESKIVLEANNIIWDIEQQRVHIIRETGDNISDKVQQFDNAIDEFQEAKKSFPFFMIVHQARIVVSAYKELKSHGLVDEDGSGKKIAELEAERAKLLADLSDARHDAEELKAQNAKLQTQSDNLGKLITTLNDEKKKCENRLKEIEIGLRPFKSTHDLFFPPVKPDASKWNQKGDVGSS